MTHVVLIEALNTDDDDNTMTTYLENNFMTYVSFGGG